MDLTPYIDNLRRELAVAANAGGDEARALAERLTAPLESAARLALLEALTAAADEITRDLAPGSVDVRLRGRDPGFVVMSPPDWAAEDTPASSAEVGPPPAPAETDESGGTSRITLRLPESLKPRVDDAAARAGVSVNAWLVRAVSAALDPGPQGARTDAPGGFGKRYTGWVR